MKTEANKNGLTVKMLIQKPTKRSRSIVIAVNRFFKLLLESTQVTVITFTFIFLFFSGLIIAPTVWLLKRIWAVWGKYYNWLFDWYF